MIRPPGSSPGGAGSGSHPGDGGSSAGNSGHGESVDRAALRRLLKAVDWLFSGDWSF